MFLQDMVTSVLELCSYPHTCADLLFLPVMSYPTPSDYVSAGHGDLRAGAVQLSPHLR